MAGRAECRGPRAEGRVRIACADFCLEPGRRLSPLEEKLRISDLKSQRPDKSDAREREEEDEDDDLV